MVPDSKYLAPALAKVELPNSPSFPNLAKINKSISKVQVEIEWFVALSPIIVLSQLFIKALVISSSEKI